MRRLRLNNTVSLLINLVTAILIITCIVTFFYKISYFSELDLFVKLKYNNLKVKGTNVFRYFTIDSNILATIACLVLVVENFLVIIRKKDHVSSWAITLKYVAAVALGVTFITSLAYLVPTAGFAKAFAGRNLILHLITPFLVISSFLYIEKGEISFFHSFMSILPTFFYGIVYMIMVVYLKEWKDIYFLNKNGAWAISFTAMHVGTILIGIILWLLHRQLTRKINPL